MSEEELMRAVNELKKKIEEGYKELVDVEVPEEGSWAEYLGIDAGSPCKTINDPCDSDVFVDIVKEYIESRGFDWYEVRDDVLEELENWLMKENLSSWDAVFCLWASECAEGGGVPVRLTHYGDREWELFACLSEEELKRVESVLDCVNRTKKIVMEGMPRELYERIVDLLGSPRDLLEAFDEIIYDPVRNSEVLGRIIEIVKCH